MVLESEFLETFQDNGIVMPRAGRHPGPSLGEMFVNYQRRQRGQVTVIVLPAEPPQSRPVERQRGG
jgi:hypothetical protein